MVTERFFEEKEGIIEENQLQMNKLKEKHTRESVVLKQKLEAAQILKGQLLASF